MPNPDPSAPHDAGLTTSAAVALLLELVAPVPVDRDRFTIDISPHVEGHLFGGLVAAQALHAAYTTVAPDRRAQSAHAYFLRRGRPELPIEFEVHRDTDGRSFSARRVAAIQEGLPIFTMVCSFHVPEDTVEIQPPVPVDRHPRATMPVDTFHTMEGALEIHRELVDSDESFEHRLGRRLWVRVAGPIPDDAALHDCLLFYISDLGSPWNNSAPPGLRPTTSLDHAIWLHARTRMDAWHYIDLETTALADARGLYTGRVWHEDGTYVASLAQENLLRPPVA